MTANRRSARIVGWVVALTELEQSLGFRLVQRGVNIYGVLIALAGSVTRRRLVDNGPPVTDRRGAGTVEGFTPFVLSSHSL